MNEDSQRIQSLQHWYEELSDAMSSPDGESEEIQAIRRLWRMVIIQAWMDAQSNINDGGAQAFKAQARAWLQSSSSDFKYVCEMAGWSHMRVSRGFRRLYSLDMRSTTYGMSEDGQFNFNSHIHITTDYLLPSNQPRRFYVSTPRKRPRRSVGGAEQYCFLL
jgi:hypothetical protein